MVFAINAPAAPNERSFEAYKALAIARNGTAAASSPAATDTWTPPPPQPWQSATATVTWQGSTWATTYSSYLGSPDPTPAPAPVEHKIIVGADNGLVYAPTTVAAKVGDTVTFEFQSKNHTVTQSSFSKPCVPLLKDDGTSGFKSGFRPVAGATPESLTFSVKINDTAPIWGYCGQTGHCQSGMVFAINSVEDGPNNFTAFQQIAVRTNSSSATVGGGSNSTNGTSGTGNGGSQGGAVHVSASASGVLALVAFAALGALVL
jgi:plastocyanin